MSEIKGLGSVVQLEKEKPRSRCRKWRLVADLGVDPVSKKRRPPKTRRFPSREELLGLTWGCLANDVLRVVKVRNIDDPGLADTKTPSRGRITPLFESALRA